MKPAGLIQLKDLSRSGPTNTYIKGDPKMKPHAWTCLLFLVCCLSTIGCSGKGEAFMAQTSRDLCNCGPDTCLGDPRYPPKLAKKKADLKKNKFPDELIALLDRDGKCVMAIDQAPDTFRILLVAPNGDNRSIEWTRRDEDIANKELLDGTIKAYYKHNVRKAFACCGEKKAEERPDWDSALALSRNLSIICSKQGDAVVCK